MVNSYRNTISEWAVVVRYENFFIPRVKKSSKISPWEKNLASRGPTALGRTTFFALGLILEDFSTLRMKKFQHLKTGLFRNPIFLIFWLFFVCFLFPGHKLSVKLVLLLLICPKYYDSKWIDFWKLWCKISSIWYPIQPKSCPALALWLWDSSFRTLFRKSFFP